MFSDLSVQHRQLAGLPVALAFEGCDLGPGALDLGLQGRCAGGLRVRRVGPLLALGDQGLVVRTDLLELGVGLLDVGLEVLRSLLPSGLLLGQGRELDLGVLVSRRQPLDVPLPGLQLAGEGLAPGALLLGSGGLGLERSEPGLEADELVVPGLELGLLAAELRPQGLDPPCLDAALLRLQVLDAGPELLEALLLGLALSHHPIQVRLLEDELGVDLLDGAALPGDLILDLPEEGMLLRPTGLELGETRLHRRQLQGHRGALGLGLGLAGPGLLELLLFGGPRRDDPGQALLLGGRAGARLPGRDQGLLDGHLLDQGLLVGQLPLGGLALGGEADLLLLRGLGDRGAALLLAFDREAGRGELRLRGRELGLGHGLELLLVLALGLELTLERGLLGRGLLERCEPRLLGGGLTGEVGLLRAGLLLLDLHEAALLRAALGFELEAPGLLGHGLQLRRQALLLLPRLPRLDEEGLLLLPGVRGDLLLLLLEAAGLGEGRGLLLLQAQLLLGQGELLLLLRELGVHRGLELHGPLPLLFEGGGLRIGERSGALLGLSPLRRRSGRGLGGLLGLLEAGALGLEGVELLLLQLRQALRCLALFLGLGLLGASHRGELLGLEVLGLGPRLLCLGGVGELLGLHALRLGLGLEGLQARALLREVLDQLLLVDAGLVGLALELLLPLPGTPELGEEVALALDGLLEVLAFPRRFLGLRVGVRATFAVDEDQDLITTRLYVVGRLTLEGHDDPRGLDAALPERDGPDLRDHTVEHLHGLCDLGDVPAGDVDEQSRGIRKPEHAERGSGAPIDGDQGRLRTLLDLDVTEDVLPGPSQSCGRQQQGAHNDECFDFHGSPRLAALSARQHGIHFSPLSV